MQQHFQTTLGDKVVLNGVGLHSGQPVRCAIHPAPSDYGIVFLRTDLKNKPAIRADISKVVRTDLCTTLGLEGKALVGTVEHLMAALMGLGIDNALVELNGPEVPILDGSSYEFAMALTDVGVDYLSTPRKIMRLRRKMTVRHNDKLIIAEPADHFSVTGSIQFGHKAIGQQKYTFDMSRSFMKELAAARTFGFLREVEYLHKKGLALGGSLENAIVLDEERVLNSEGLRFQDEFVRHKVLDAIGDFALLGMPLQAKIEVHKAGHELHTGFLNKVLEDPANYEIIIPAAPVWESVAAEEEVPSLVEAYGY